MKGETIVSRNLNGWRRGQYPEKEIVWEVIERKNLSRSPFSSRFESIQPAKEKWRIQSTTIDRTRIAPRWGYINWLDPPKIIFLDVLHRVYAPIDYYVYVCVALDVSARRVYVSELHSSCTASAANPIDHPTRWASFSLFHFRIVVTLQDFFGILPVAENRNNGTK